MERKIIQGHFPPRIEVLTAPIVFPDGSQIPKFKYLGFKLPEKLNLDDLNKICEDSQNFKRIDGIEIFAVADGITWRGSGEDEFPFPSPAKEVADIFTSFLNEEILNEEIKTKNPLSFIENYFYQTNLKIKDYNKKRLGEKEINYWEIDYAHLSALLGIVKDNFLYYGLIGDNFVFVFDKDGNLKHQSKKIDYFHRHYPNQELIEKLKKQIEKEKRKPQDGESLGRKYFRNKLDENGLPYGYGVLTGEESALNYLIYESIPLEQDDIIILATDGFLPFIEDEEVKRVILWGEESELKEILAQKRDERPLNFGKEASFYIIRC